MIARPTILNVGACTITILCPRRHVLANVPRDQWAGSYWEARAGDPRFTVTCDGTVCAPTPDVERRRAAAWQDRYEMYAARFLAEHDDPENCCDRAEPTDEAMAATFAPCCIPARPEWYPYIREAIARQRTEAASP